MQEKIKVTDNEMINSVQVGANIERKESTISAKESRKHTHPLAIIFLILIAEASG